MDTDHPGYNHFGAPIPDDESKYDDAGKAVSDYIPNYISSKPWYYEEDALKVDSNLRRKRAAEPASVDKLRHQRLDPDAEFVPNSEPRKGAGIADEYDFVAEETKRRRTLLKKGGCENCGSTKHSRKDCLEKPRKISFKYRKQEPKSGSGKVLRVKKDTQDWETKRDRWHGFNNEEDYEEHLKTMREIEQKRTEHTTTQDYEYDEDELAEMEELGITEILANSKTMIASGTNIPTRALDEKAKYLEGVGITEPQEKIEKTTVDDNKAKFLSEEGEFVRQEFGEAEEFEKQKRFANTKQNKDNGKFVLGEPLTGHIDVAEAPPAAERQAMKENEVEKELIRETKRRQLLEKYGAL
ncbi:hypothetical protein KL948_001392 [Ogataea haglerorum]|uniref:Pre-mRNA-splicing factor SLU7 n=1 Tax=Ogataea haglerorum TaxID=1937702 RepID=A0ABQ7RDX0_9ASCO|nr:hypothetical protein KL948_001392 [Ogataea haglerorum]KAG7763967.1 hypothetical protein KL946_003407 [Ogataea haglerorum]